MTTTAAVSHLDYEERALAATARWLTDLDGGALLPDVPTNQLTKEDHQ